MDEIVRDKRFAHVAKDPRFRRVPIRERKVKIDSRFKGMFKDKRFKLKYSVDKRGRPLNVTTNENLKKFYELSDEASSDDDDDELVSSRIVADESDDSEVNDNKMLLKSKEKRSLDNSRIFTEVKEGKSDRTQGGKKKKKDTEERKNENEKELDSRKRKTLVQNTNKKVLGRSEYEQDIDSLQQDSLKQKQGPSVKTSDPRFQVKEMEEKFRRAFDNSNIPASKQKGGQFAVQDRNTDLEGQTDEESEESELELEDDESEEEENDCESGSSEEDEKPVGNDSGIDFARGEGNISSSSSDDDSDDDGSDHSEEKSDSELDHRWGELDDNAEAVEEATSRLAVCNMDWDRMKAKDIYVLLNSFKPSDGLIKSVKVYPSEYGKKRMAEEATQGPKELKELKLDSDEEEEEEDQQTEDREGTVYHREKLRQYQLNRLKYYYAVVECDSQDTADHIYKECDGMEYESSATKLDLRFIPEEETFEEADISSECHEVLPGYKPQFFFNAALSQSKVDLTWDETDRERVQLTAEQFTKKGEEDEEEDLKAYLASSSDEEGPDYSAIFEKTEEDEEEEEDSDEERKLDKYKLLLSEIDKEEEKKKKKDVEMEISWEPGLKEATENLVKKKKESKSKTVWEDYLEKKKEKKKQKLEERKKMKQRQKLDSESADDQADRLPMEGEEVQAFSDDELPVDGDMADFMAEERGESSGNSKDKKRKNKRKKTDVTKPENSQEQAELSLLVMDEEDNKNHFNLRDLMQEEGKKKKKKKQKEQKQTEEDNFKMDVKDPRFSAMYESHLFNIDPSAPEYRKTKGMDALVTEKLKRSGKRNKRKDHFSKREDDIVKKQKLIENNLQKDNSLETLIKSVKSKTKHFQSNRLIRGKNKEK